MGERPLPTFPPPPARAGRQRRPEWRAEFRDRRSPGPSSSWASRGRRSAAPACFSEKSFPRAPCHPRPRPSVPPPTATALTSHREAEPREEVPTKCHEGEGQCGAVGSEKGLLETGPQGVHLPGMQGPRSLTDEGLAARGAAHSSPAYGGGGETIGFLLPTTPQGARKLVGSSLGVLERTGQPAEVWP